MWARAPPRPVAAPRPCAPRADPSLSRVMGPRPALPPSQSASHRPALSSIPRPLALQPLLARNFATDAKAPAVVAEPKKPAADPRAFPDVSPFTGLPKPPGMWREIWHAGEETSWISPPIPVTKRIKRNPYQWKLLFKKRQLKQRDLKKKTPKKILLTNHVVQLITTGKPLNDRRKLTFKIPIKMSKITLRQYLSKLYALDVAKVNTMNVEGKWKRRTDGKGRFKVFKEANWKKAYVTLRNALPIAPTPEPAKPAAAATP